MPPDTTPSTPERDLDFGDTLRGLREGMKVFGRYTLERQLGRGGMGVVWLARDEKLELEVALKFVAEALVNDEVALDDLRRETRRTIRLTHSNIVRVFDLVEEKGTAAIVMEHVGGKTLSGIRLEAESRVVEPETLLPLVEQVCEALTYAHEVARIVHHDLKPTNIMVTAEGQVKVMDFGIASSLHESVSRRSRKMGTSHSGTGGGTLPYMSPQQLLGFPASVADDVYALGATLYELLSGKPPFFRGSLEGQIQSVVPPGMMERRAELGIEGAGAISKAWEETIAACLEKAAELRPQSVREVWERLSGGAAMKATGGKFEQNVPQEPVVGRSASRRPLVAGALVAGVLGLAGLGWWGMRAGRVRTPIVATQPETPPSNGSSGDGGEGANQVPKSDQARTSGSGPETAMNASKESPPDRGDPEFETFKQAMAAALEGDEVLAEQVAFLQAVAAGTPPSAGSKPDAAALAGLSLATLRQLGRSALAEIGGREFRLMMLAKEQPPVDEGTDLLNLAQLIKPPKSPEPVPREPAPAASAALVAQSRSSSQLSAQSTRAEGRITYGPSKLTDGDLDTAWVEGVSGTGVGEWVEFDFAKTVSLSAVSIYSGYGKNTDIYSKNGRATKLEMTFSNEQSFTLTFDKGARMHRFELGRPVETESVRFRIVEAVRGSKYDDTAISEIRFE
jgi:serine/threonine protein kinase